MKDIVQLCPFATDTSRGSGCPCPRPNLMSFRSKLSLPLLKTCYVSSGPNGVSSQEVIALESL